MSTLQQAVDDFLAQSRIAVAGVSRQPGTGNFIYRRLRDAGYEVFALNPRAESVEGEACYPSLAALPVLPDAVFAATPPAGTQTLVEECLALGITRIWMHEGIGPTSVSPEAVEAARAGGMLVIAGACPMMFLHPVDPFHTCLRAIKRLTRRLPEPVLPEPLRTGA